MNRIYIFLTAILAATALSSAQYKEADTSGFTQNGVYYRYTQENSGYVISNFDLVNIKRSGLLDNIELSAKLQDSIYGFEFTTHFLAADSGTYAFYVISEGDVEFYIGDSLHIYNETDTLSEDTATVQLDSGLHRIRLFYFEDLAPDSLALHYSSKSVSKTPVPDSLFFRPDGMVPYASPADTSMMTPDSISLPLIITDTLTSNPLTVSAYAGKDWLIHDSNIVITDTGLTHMIYLKATYFSSDTTVVWIEIENTEGYKGYCQFTLALLSKLPQSTFLPDTAAYMGTAITRSIFVSDLNNDLDSLIMNGGSSDTSIVPNDSVIFSGTGDHRYIHISPISGRTGEVRINFSVMDPDGMITIRNFTIDYFDTASADFRDPEFQDTSSLTQGLYFLRETDHSWGAVEDFSTTIPDYTGFEQTVNTNSPDADSGFASEWRGYVYIPVSGLCTFYTNSINGSIVFIGNERIVYNDGSHIERERSGSIKLKSGYHAITVQYATGTANKLLEISYHDLHTAKDTIPASAYFRLKNELPVISDIQDTSMNMNVTLDSVLFTVDDTELPLTFRTASSDTGIIDADDIAVNVLPDGYSLSVTSAKDTGTVEITVMATDSLGYSAMKKVLITVKESIAISVKLQPIPENITVYPNPAADFIYIKAAGPIQFRLRDAKGGIIRSGLGRSIDVSSLPPGIYLLTLTDEERTLRKKIVKQ
jgi:hypothetical protein